MIVDHIGSLSNKHEDLHFIHFIRRSSLKNPSHRFQGTVMNPGIVKDTSHPAPEDIAVSVIKIDFIVAEVLESSIGKAPIEAATIVLETKDTENIVSDFQNIIFIHFQNVVCPIVNSKYEMEQNDLFI